MHIANLYRYPVKGLSPERLNSVQTIAGDGFPRDRMYALLRTQATFDPATPTWLAKANFIMLMLHERIASLKTRYSEQDQSLTIRTEQGEELKFTLSDESERTALEQFFLEFIPHLGKAPRLVEARGHQFTDKAEKYISLINLASLRELETQWEEDLDPLRFRANVYIDGAEPFSELDWIGRDIRLGQTTAKVVKRNGRCAATNVNPITGVRDRNVPGKLRATFGHKDLGVYLSVTQGGILHEGDPVEIDATNRDRIGTIETATKITAPLICTACYYLFDPRDLNASWTTPQDLPESWRCPDCGTTRGSVAVGSTHQTGAI